MEKIRLGLIGLGNRGTYLMETSILPQNDLIALTAVCDVYEDRVQRALDMAKEKGQSPKGFTDYRDLLASGLVDAVIISTAWEPHCDISCDAMEAHVAVGCEVGGFYSLDDCYRLIHTQRRTGTPFMLLENCNYDRREMTLAAMARAGIFGQIVGCDGGYMHDCRPQIAGGERNRHYRQRNYLNRNCHNYPTHDLGPIAQIMGLGKNNRMVSLVSVASGAFGMNAYMNEYDKENPVANARFAQGDLFTTIITCSGGQTVTLRLETTLPRYYSRGLCVHGTRGMYSEDSDTLFLEEAQDKNLICKLREYEKEHPEFLHENWKAVDNGLVVEGHGGMDYFMLRDFITCLQNGKPFPTDVYDAVSLLCITPLSEQSVRTGAPVAIPDFSGGKFIFRS